MAWYYSDLKFPLYEQFEGHAINWAKVKIHKDANEFMS